MKFLCAGDMDIKDCRSGAAQDFFWFKAKEKLIDVLLGKLKSKKRLKILNIGSGTGHDIAVMQRFGDVFAVDLDPESLDLIPDDLVVEKKISDVCSMPYQDGFFDAAVAFDVLEHIKDDTKAVKEIRRVLNRDGFFIFTVPAFNILFSSHDRALNHYRRYNKNMIKLLCKDFSARFISFWVFLLFIPVAVQRLLKRNDETPKVHCSSLPAVINHIFYRILLAETRLIELGIRLPLGTTICGIYQKRSS